MISVSASAATALSLANKQRSNTTTTFASWLKKQRVNRKMAYAELARLAGCSVATLYDIERGNSSPSLDTVEKICKALNVSVEAALRVRPIKSMETSCAPLKTPTPAQE